MPNKVVGSMSDWSGVLKDLFRQIDDGSITLETIKAVVGHCGPDKIADLLVDWTIFWSKRGFAIGDISVPEKRPGFDRLLVIPQGLTIEQVFGICQKLFKVWRYTNQDLDEAIPTNDRTSTNGSYAIWVRDRVEADEEFKNQSANTLKAVGHTGITVLERLIYEAKYFDETGKHLDITNITLCAGSRYSDGGVPVVSWDGGNAKLFLGWCDPGYASGLLRSRAVVAWNLSLVACTCFPSGLHWWSPDFIFLNLRYAESG